MGFAEEFVGRLAELRFEDAFNPYADVCPVYDLQDAPALRRAALAAIIDRAQERGVDSLWVGLAPGRLGARRTGLAFTDDCALQAHGERWGVDIERPTTGPEIRERTAQAVWEELRRIDEGVFLWNVFPLHPHQPDNPSRNRNLRRQERLAGCELLAKLIDALDPQCLVAVGNEAEKAVLQAGGNRTYDKVRHPSYGGKTEFSEAIRRLYR